MRHLKPPQNPVRGYPVSVRRTHIDRVQSTAKKFVRWNNCTLQLGDVPFTV
ncbi:MAG: hypothetical protein JW384_03553 [Nitrosomonadaceae bacterium]|nr:hypothetical protein [Nitrosomonadaceae bacterium]